MSEIESVQRLESVKELKTTAYTYTNGAPKSNILPHEDVPFWNSIEDPEPEDHKQLYLILLSYRLIIQVNISSPFGSV
ncbi:hypothetical protein KFK09_027268 [Dendrobium nobile]|uniref:Uncharacterized protein n=1 Tax=Dendrobium nobile TaxID=94219 RepID=A0A8T3AB38_DENNO|nr:hypothetical protein KFK09_027268 [Dendrobium nobile]